MRGTGKGARHIHRGHQAGIKAYQLQGRIVFIGFPHPAKGSLHLIQG